MRNVFLLLFLFSVLPAAHAQVDLTQEMQLGTSGVTGNAGLESGRYKVRSSKSIEKPDAAPPIAKRKAVLKRSPMSEMLFSPPAAPISGETSKAVEKPVEKPADSSVDAPAITDQVKNLVLGENQPAVEAYKEQIHSDDIRMNLLEVTIAPGVVSNSSKSNYSYRDYSTFSPQLLIGAEFWATPFMGVYGEYRSTMAGDVAGGTTVSERISAKHEWTELGFDVRKFFGLSRRANSVQFGLHLSEYRFTVPGDDLSRVNLRSAGVGLHVLARIPVAPTYSWTFGGKLIPRVTQNEVATGIDLSSGDKTESSRVDLSLGGEFKFSRQNQLIWDISMSLEKSVFGGSANRVDPQTGAAPKGVSVENTFSLFTLGYRWGQ